MKATFEDTVSILVKAYMNDTLEHSNYCACAVGNLIAYKVGAKIIPWTGGGCGSKYRWDHPEFTGNEWYSPVCGDEKNGRTQIMMTGYTAYEIMVIEKAFESQRFYDIEDSYHGLMAVLTVLAEIHNVDLDTTENARKLFVK